MSGRASVRALLLAIACVALVSLVALLWGLRDAPRHDGFGVEREPTPVVPGPVEPPPSSAREMTEVDARGAGRLESESTREANSARWARVFLVGQLTSREGALEPQMLVVRPGSMEQFKRGRGNVPSVVGRSEAGGQFRFDVSPLYPRAVEEMPTLLWLQVIRPTGQPTEVQFDLTQLEKRGGGGVGSSVTKELLARGGEIEVLVGEVALRETCVVRGIAYVAEEPKLTVDIAAFPMRDGAPELEPVALATINELGREFTLELDCERDFVVLAFADGFRPQTAVVPAGTSTLDALVLERGERLVGQVRLDGQGVECTVLASLAAAAGVTQFPSVNGVDFVWTGTSLEWRSRSARASAERGFELSGLMPTLYDLRVVAVTGAYAAAGTDSADIPDSRHLATALDIVLEPQVVIVEADVFVAGQIAPHALVALRTTLPDGNARLGSARADALGRIRVWCAPGAELVFTFGADFRVQCGAAGTMQSLRIGD